MQEGLGNGGASALLFFCRFVDYITGIWSCLQGFFRGFYKKIGMGGIPPPSALWAMCITSRLMELWATLFAGCGKAAFAFPYAVNSVVHSGMGSYAHFHDALLLLKPFSDRELPGRVIIPVRLFLCAFCRLCAP